VRALAQGGAALAALVAAPVGLAGIAVSPRWRQGWRERVGLVEPVEPGAVWVHGASVGEVMATLPLHDALAKHGCRTLASTKTLTGRAVLCERRPDLPRLLAPLDHPWCVAMALDRVRPAALVLVETELWPVWIATAHRRNVPVVLVSGRLSDRSFPRYRRFAFVFRRTLARLAGVGARSRQDAERFVSLGLPRGRVEVTGDLKLEPRSGRVPSRDLEAFVRDASALLVAGSTHHGEEEAALDALEAAERAGFAPALVLAPRHPERFDEVEALVRKRGRRVQRRSRLAGGRLGTGEVLLLDSLGELADLYARAAACFVGGTLAPVGGHNLLEPLAAGRSVLFGPHTENAREVATLVLASGAGRRVADAQELARCVVEELADPRAALERGERGRAALERHRGAAERSAHLVLRVLESRR
jgi:3-deoxy-D-manno-octulosonic-acid transferase